MAVALPAVEEADGAFFVAAAVLVLWIFVDVGWNWFTDECVKMVTHDAIGLDVSAIKWTCINTVSQLKLTHLCFFFYCADRGGGRGPPGGRGGGRGGGRYVIDISLGGFFIQISF